MAASAPTAPRNTVMRGFLIAMICRSARSTGGQSADASKAICASIEPHSGDEEGLVTDLAGQNDSAALAESIREVLHVMDQRGEEAHLNKFQERSIERTGVDVPRGS
jgi:hypothetical protein